MRVKQNVSHDTHQEKGINIKRGVCMLIYYIYLAIVLPWLDSYWVNQSFLMGSTSDFFCAVPVRELLPATTQWPQEYGCVSPRWHQWKKRISHRMASCSESRPFVSKLAYTTTGIPLFKTISTIIQASFWIIRSRCWVWGWLTGSGCPVMERSDRR